LIKNVVLQSAAREGSTKPFERKTLKLNYSFENKRTHDMNGQRTDLTLDILTVQYFKHKNTLPHTWPNYRTNLQQPTTM
jgi:hypothetical protein